MFFKPYLVIFLSALASHVSAGRNYEVDVCAYYLRDHAVIDRTSGYDLEFSLQLHQKGLPAFTYLAELRHLSRAVTADRDYYFRNGQFASTNKADVNFFFIQISVERRENDDYQDIVEHALELPLRCLSPQKNIRCVRLLIHNYALELMIY